MNAKWKRRLRAAALPFCSVVGVLMAFGVVLAWFPQTGNAWNLPLQEIDAPAHYYFIRKILREGLGAATRLWPNGAYYPPMFHLTAAAIISVGQFLGIKVNIYTAFNIVWLVTSGLVWPAGVSLWASYWTRQVDGKRHDSFGDNVSFSRVSRVSSHAASDTAFANASEVRGSCGSVNLSSPVSWRPFSCCMMLVVPLLAVASASHPFQMLASGPLIAFGLATTLLPYWLYVTLRLFDAIADRLHIVRWLAATVLVGLLCVFAHPRIAFTWLLLMAPFILLRLPWKLILGALAAVVVCAVAFFFYMIGHYHSSRYLDPSSWFHTFVPNRTMPEALRIFVTDNISGPAGWFMAVAVVLSLVVAVAAVVVTIKSKLSVRKSNGRNDNANNAGSAGRYMAKDAISLILAFFLVGLVYVCSTSLTGWFPNIVAAAWYRAETRPLTMIPLAIIPLLVFAACAVAQLSGHQICSGVIDKTESNAKANLVDSNGAVAETVLSNQTVGSGSRQDDAMNGVSPSRRANGGIVSWFSRNGGKAIALIVLAALAISCQFGNTTREVLSQGVTTNMTLSGKPQDEQLTLAKYDVLQKTVKITGTDALIISDPLNGSMYASAIFGANMLFPIYNAMHEKGGAVFPATEAAFDSGQAAQLTSVTCPIDGSVPKYFLSMGPQAPSLKMFTFRQQYDTFHRQDLIDGYVQSGALVKVKDFSSEGSYAKGWALYRITCGK
ncbi:hypothetical protein OZX57_00935 [Bifidobacterium sp. ESL0682]|uniref:DUF6541 family protein n=1 Tax=Bifidobacterium sp. ESL0682 TaxID=2983212 RepID=UPI0023F6FD1E|nr:DUF6541 family protein [Bifidobacterium sp. ESL0682]WEV42668.1 hypothetical protein OZX57_00935 [Bifidobacterium sp. ESL0682]